MSVSIAIPCYDMNGAGGEVLDYSFSKLHEQTYKDFDITITDHSAGLKTDVMNVCSRWSDIGLDIKYFRIDKKIGNPAFNTNKSIELSKFDIVKLLCQDDYLANKDSLKIMMDNFKPEDIWMATTYVHSSDRNNFYRYHTPSVNPNIHTTNTIGTPSCILIRKDKHLGFDDNLKWMYDCEYYSRMIDTYGNPKILSECCMVNYIHDNQTTNTIANEYLRNSEIEYVSKKYGG